MYHSKRTDYEKAEKYLTEMGLQLPDLPHTHILNVETFLSSLVEAYESIGSEIDISQVNPRHEVSDAVKN